MALPILKLNLAPPPTLWRQYHLLIGWTVLAAGIVALAGTLAMTLLTYRKAAQDGRKVVDLTSRKSDISRKEAALRSQLESIDVEKELPRWRLAERILAERAQPWSRLTVELERCLVQDVRIRNIQRTRNSAQKVELKLRGEARNRAAEDAFIESLHKNEYFTQVILEREADNQAGSIEFDCVLAASTMPPACEPLPKYGPSRTSGAAPAPQPAPAPAPVKPAPQKAAPSRPAPVAQSMPQRHAPSNSRPMPIRMAPSQGVQGNPSGQTPPVPPPNYRPGMPMQPIQRSFPNRVPPQNPEGGR